MSLHTEATIDDLRRAPGKAELVGGKIITMPLVGWLHGHAKLEIMCAVHDYAKQTGCGVALGGNVAYIVNLPNRQSFCPCASYYIGPLGPDFIIGAPIFAVEIRDEEHYGPAAEKMLADKRADYFAAGTQVVWDVDVLRDEIVRVFRVGVEPPTIYRRGEMAEAEPALPGWAMPVEALFEKT